VLAGKRKRPGRVYRPWPPAKSPAAITVRQMTYTISDTTVRRQEATGGNSGRVLQAIPPQIHYSGPADAPLEAPQGQELPVLDLPAWKPDSVNGCQPGVDTRFAEYTLVNARKTGVNRRGKRAYRGRGRPVEHYLNTQDSGDRGWTLEPDGVCGLGIKGVKCGSPWCPICGRMTAIKNVKKMEKILPETGALWAIFTLTVDRGPWPGPSGPMECYEDLVGKRALSQFTRRGRRKGKFTGQYLAFLEWQGGRWAHYHVACELTEAFGARLARAAKQGGYAIIKINNEEIAPLWGFGFTSTTFGMDAVKIACYAAAHSAAGRKEIQKTLPVWYDEWRLKTGKKRMQKWSFSRGFWDALKDLEDVGAEELKHPQSDLRDRRRRLAQRSSTPQRPTSVIIAACGNEDSLLYVEIAGAYVDDAGEIKEEGYYRLPLARLPGGVIELVDRLRRAGVDVYQDADGEHWLPLDALRSVRSILDGKWFGWNRLSALGIDDDGLAEVELVSETVESGYEKAQGVP